MRPRQGLWQGRASPEFQRRLESASLTAWRWTGRAALGIRPKPRGWQDNGREWRCGETARIAYPDAHEETVVVSGPPGSSGGSPFMLRGMFPNGSEDDWDRRQLLLPLEAPTRGSGGTRSSVSAASTRRSWDGRREALRSGLRQPTRIPLQPRHSGDHGGRRTPRPLEGTEEREACSQRPIQSRSSTPAPFGNAAIRTKHRSGKPEVRKELKWHELFDQGHSRGHQHYRNPCTEQAWRALGTPIPLKPEPAGPRGAGWRRTLPPSPRGPTRPPALRCAD